MGAGEDPIGDRELVRRTLAGDRDAFAHLHRRYYARIYRLALFRCRNVPDAEDIASETFLRAIAHLPAYRFQGETVYPWLARIATNLAHDLARRVGPAAPLSLDAGAAEDVRALIESLRDDAPGPHALAERREVQEVLKAAVAALPSDQADAILLRFGGDLPLAEIAVALGRSEGAIKSLIHRGLVNLRKGLREEQVRGRTSATASASVDEETRAPVRRIEL